MGALSVVLLVFFGITAVLLVIIVLLQDEQSEGLGGIFGGSATNQVGNRKGNILTKTTTVLGVLFLTISFGLAWINRSNDIAGLDAPAANSADSTTFEWWKESSVSPDEAAPVPGDPVLDATQLENPEVMPSAAADANAEITQ